MNTVNTAYFCSNVRASVAAPSGYIVEFRHTAVHDRDYSQLQVTRKEVRSTGSCAGLARGYYIETENSYEVDVTAFKDISNKPHTCFWRVDVYYRPGMGVSRDNWAYNHGAESRVIFKASWIRSEKTAMILARNTAKFICESLLHGREE